MNHRDIDSYPTRERSARHSQLLDLFRLAIALVLIMYAVLAAAEQIAVSRAAADQPSGTLCGEFPGAATAGGPEPLVENGPRIRWSTPVPEHLWFLVPVDDDQIGLAFVSGAHASSAIAVLDAATGNVNWCKNLEWQEIGALGSVDGVVVATSREPNPDDPGEANLDATGQTLALDAQSGAELWHLDRALALPFQFESDDIILEIVEDESQLLLTGVDALTCQARWQHEMPPGSIASWPVVAHGLVHIPTLPHEGQSDRTVLTLDALTGEERWSTAIEVDFEYFGVSPSSSDLLFAHGATGGNRETNVLALERETGSIVWQSAGPTVEYTSPLVADDNLFIGSFFDFAAFDSATGEELWRVQLGLSGYGGPIDGSSAVSKGQLVIFGTPYKSTETTDLPVVGVDVESGDVLWEFSLDRPDLNEPPSPIVAGDAVIVISSELLALEVQS